MAQSRLPILLILSNQVLDAFDHRIGEESNHDSVEGENTGDLFRIHLLILVFQAAHGHPADNQAPKVKLAAGI